MEKTHFHAEMPSRSRDVRNRIFLFGSMRLTLCFPIGCVGNLSKLVLHTTAEVLCCFLYFVQFSLVIIIVFQSPDRFICTGGNFLQSVHRLSQPVCHPLAIPHFDRPIAHASHTLTRCQDPIKPYDAMADSCELSLWNSYCLAN